MAKKKLQPPPEPVVLDLDIPEEAIAFVERMTDEEARGVLLQAKALLARQSDSPAGFAAFYEVITGEKLPAHTQRWVEELYAVKNAGEKKGIVIEAFRGSTKTTTLTILFTAYRIGKEPQRANLLIQVGDDIAADNTAQVADLIANNAGWKLVFPSVEPDRERGWGAGGYEVKRTDVSYSEWRQLNAQRKDPTLVGVGYKSREIMGK